MKIAIKWLNVSNRFIFIILRYVDDWYKLNHDSSVMMRIWWPYWSNRLITRLIQLSVQYIFNAIIHLQHTVLTYLSDGVTHSPIRDCLNWLQQMDANTKMKPRSSSSWFLNDSHGSVSRMETLVWKQPCCCSLLFFSVSLSLSGQRTIWFYHF